MGINSFEKLDGEVQGNSKRFGSTSQRGSKIATDERSYRLQVSPRFVLSLQSFIEEVQKKKTVKYLILSLVFFSHMEVRIFSQRFQRRRTLRDQMIKTLDTTK